MPEVRLIDANALLAHIKNLEAHCENKKYEQAMQDMLDGYFPEIIANQPTIEAGTRLDDLPSPGKYYHRSGDLTPEPVRIPHKDPTQGPPPDTDLQTAQALHNAVDAAFREEMRRQASRMIIAVDFDGTLCEQAWPEIGPARWSVINAILDAQRQGARIILWTNRAGAALTRAVEWCEARGLHFDAVNENLPEIIEQYGSDSRKITADVYVDDKVLAADTLAERWENRQAWLETVGKTETKKEE